MAFPLVVFVLMYCFLSRTDVNHDAPRDAPSPQVGWGVYKEEHPDQFRTPVKEENNFNWEESEIDHYRGRSSKDRGGRFPRRNHDGYNRGGGGGGRGGRGVWNQENQWKNGRPAPNGNIPPFLANSGPPMQNFPFMRTLQSLPDFFPDAGDDFSQTPEMIRNEVIPMLVDTTSPEIIRKKVIPMLVQMGEEGKRTGSLNEGEFRNLMEKVNAQCQFILFTTKFVTLTGSFVERDKSDEGTRAEDDEVSGRQGEQKAR